METQILRVLVCTSPPPPSLEHKRIPPARVVRGVGRGWGWGVGGVSWRRRLGAAWYGKGQEPPRPPRYVCPRHPPPRPPTAACIEKRPPTLRRFAVVVATVVAAAAAADSNRHARLHPSVLRQHTRLAAQHRGPIGLPVGRMVLIGLTGRIGPPSIRTGSHRAHRSPPLPPRAAGTAARSPRRAARSPGRGIWGGGGGGGGGLRVGWGG